MNSDKKDFGGGWSDKKLDVLAEYLQQYTTALKKQPFELIYIDAFAGAGRALVEEQREDSLFDNTEIESDASYRHGSPLQAIQNEPQFHRFIFIDRNEESMATLREQCEQTDAAKSGRISYITGDANTELLKIAKSNLLGRGKRAVAFLDPYALHVTWDTIKAIAETKPLTCGCYSPPWRSTGCCRVLASFLPYGLTGSPRLSATTNGEAFSSRRRRRISSGWRRHQKRRNLSKS